jgi:hypothetical protein
MLLQYTKNLFCSVLLGLGLVSSCLTSAHATVLDTLTPREVFHYKNDVGYTDPSIAQFGTAAFELSNAVAELFEVRGLRVFAYAMYPKSHPAGKTMSFSTLWNKHLAGIEGTINVLNRGATLRSAEPENAYLLVAWQLDATGRIAEARVRCKLPTDAECIDNEGLLLIEEEINQKFHQTFVLTYNSTLSVGKAGTTSIDEAKNLLRACSEILFCPEFIFALEFGKYWSKSSS